MKLTKFPQSCVLIESNGTKILVDPGKIKFEDRFIDVWQKSDAVLVTHKHGDHINSEVLCKINKQVYSTKEVAKAYPEIKFNTIMDCNKFSIGKLDIEVVKAVHGYNPRLKGAGEVFENVGYIVNDGKTKLYITSDTICFNNDYKADVVMAPVTGFGLTMTAFETALFTKETGAKLLIVSHLDNSDYPSDINNVKDILNEQGIKYEIPKIEEVLEI